MNCPHCHGSVTPGAAFCGTCGRQLGQTSTVGSPTPTVAATPTTADVLTPNAQRGVANNPRSNPQAIAAIVFGVLGCAGWLIPIFGVILGLLAIVFGTIGLKSQKRKLALAGIILAVPVIAFSMFIWIAAAKELAQEESVATTAQSDSQSALQTITTPCYSTRLPNSLTISQNSESCDVKAISTASGELYQIKVMDVPNLSADNLAKAAKADAANVVSIISGASLANEWETSFMGSPAYAFTLGATDGSAGTIQYVYRVTSSGNLVIVFHSQRSGTNHDLATIENSWYWR